MSSERKSSFWLSYSDLLTSLFFIMLVLFVVSYFLMSVRTVEVEENLKEAAEERAQYEEEKARYAAEKARYAAEKARYEILLDLNRLFETLTKNSSTLRYEPEHCTFVCKALEGIEIFETESKVIKPEYRGTALQTGRELQELFEKLNEYVPEGRYMCVVEGQSANNGAWDPDREYNYRLSFNRALSLYKLWTDNGIDLRKYNTEILLCGSGLNGINRDRHNEANNKRFVVQILPKIGREAVLDE